MARSLNIGALPKPRPWWSWRDRKRAATIAAVALLAGSTVAVSWTSARAARREAATMVDSLFIDHGVRAGVLAGIELSGASSAVKEAARKLTLSRPDATGGHLNNIAWRILTREHTSSEAVLAMRAASTGYRMAPTANHANTLALAQLLIGLPRAAISSIQLAKESRQGDRAGLDADAVVEALIWIRLGRGGEAGECLDSIKGELDAATRALRDEAAHCLGRDQQVVRQRHEPVREAGQR